MSRGHPLIGKLLVWNLDGSRETISRFETPIGDKHYLCRRLDPRTGAATECMHIVSVKDMANGGSHHTRCEVYDSWANFMRTEMPVIDGLAIRLVGGIEVN